MSTPPASPACPHCGRRAVQADGLCADCLLALALAPASEDSAHQDPWWGALDEEAADEPGGPRIGRYDLLEEIARGGMGVVYRARQRGADRIVALKTILPHGLGSPEMVKRFRAEAEAVASLDHAAILPIYEVGEQDGLPYFSMRLAETGSLARQPKPMAARAAAALVATVARAVQHAHERGILHRDLKPGNILLDAAGRPFVCDFGLAKWLARDSSMTMSHAVLGTPGYIAPEQASGKTTLTTAADVYSLGAILFELLTGRAPFVGESAVDVLRQVVEQAPPDLRALQPGVPRDLEIICLKCLQKIPADRYASAAALADDLEAWLEGRSISARPQTRRERLVRWTQRNRALAALYAVVLALLLAVAIGSSVALVRLRAARSDTLEQLRSAALAEARATRLTGRLGQRFDALAAVERAARIRPGLDARSAAIAASALPDLRVVQRWPRLSATAANPTIFDARLERFTAELADGSVGVFGVEDGREILRLPGPGGRLEHAYAFSPDGQFLMAKFSGGATWIWRLADRRVLARLRGNPAQGLGWGSFSAHTGLVAVTRVDGGVEVFRLADLAAADQADEPVPWRVFPQTVKAQHVSFDPSGTRVVMSDLADGDSTPGMRRRPGKVVACEVESGALLWESPLPEGAGFAIWRGDGAFVAATGWDRNVHLLDGNTGRSRRVLRGHRDATAAARFNHAGTLIVSVGLDGSTRLWDVGTGECLLRWPSVEVIYAFSPDDRKLGLVLDRETVGICEAADSTTFRTWQPETAAGRPLMLEVSPQGDLVATAGFGNVHVWNARTGMSVSRQDYVLPQNVGFGRSGGRWQLLVGAAPSGFTRQAVGPGPALEAPQMWLSGEGLILRAVSGDGRRAFLTARREARAALVDVEDPARRVELGARVGRGVVHFSADGRLVAAGSTEEPGVTIWEAQSGRRVTQLDVPVDTQPSFDPAGRWLVTASGDGYRFWNRSDWRAGPRIAPALEGGAFDDWAGAFTPDGKIFACLQTGDRIALHDAATAELLAYLEPPSPITAQFLAISPESRWLYALGSDQTVQRWDLVEIRALLRGLGLDWGGENIADRR